MTDVTNTTKKQFHIKAKNKFGDRVTVRLKPGLNTVKDEDWAPFGNDPHIQALRLKGSLSFKDLAIKG